MPHQRALCYDMKKVCCQAGIKVGEMLSSHKDNIILVGMMGTGKSTVGAHLADKLGYRLIDLDQQIVQQAGCSISEIFAEKGEAYFRDLESDVLDRVLQEGGIVLATGGGAVLRESNCKCMLGHGQVVALAATVEEILSRVGEDKNRPLLAGGAKQRIETLLDERKHAYLFAHHHVNTTGKSVEQVSDEILMLCRG